MRIRSTNSRRRKQIMVTVIAEPVSMDNATEAAAGKINAVDDGAEIMIDVPKAAASENEPQSIQAPIDEDQLLTGERFALPIKNENEN